MGVLIYEVVGCIKTVLNSLPLNYQASSHIIYIMIGPGSFVLQRHIHPRPVLHLTATRVKVHIRSMGILNICNRWVLLRKIVIYLVGRKWHPHGLFCVKGDGNDVNPGICKDVFIYTDSWVDVTSSNLTAKKMTFSSDKIYYNFSQKNPKIRNI